MISNRFFPGLVIFLCACASAAEPSSQPSAAQTVAGARSRYDAGLRDLKEKYIQDLKDVLKATMAKGDLTEANHVNEAIQLAEHGEAGASSSARAISAASTTGAQSLVVRVVSVARPDVRTLQQQINADKSELTNLQNGLGKLQANLAGMQAENAKASNDPSYYNNYNRKRVIVLPYTPLAISQAQDNVLKNQDDQRKLKSRVARSEHLIADADKTRIVNGVQADGTPVQIYAKTTVHTALADTMVTGASYRIDGFFQHGDDGSPQLIMSKAVLADAEHTVP